MTTAVLAPRPTGRGVTDVTPFECRPLADTAWAERMLLDIVRLGSETLCWLIVTVVFVVIIGLY
jgi:hypothetical protein